MSVVSSFCNRKFANIKPRTGKRKGEEGEKAERRKRESESKLDSPKLAR